MSQDLSPIFINFDITNALSSRIFNKSQLGIFNNSVKKTKAEIKIKEVISGLAIIFPKNVAREIGSPQKESIGMDIVVMYAWAVATFNNQFPNLFFFLFIFS